MVRDERGSALVLIAFALSGLLAMGALALDLGEAYRLRGHFSAAADAAALAGASLLPEDRAGAVATAYHYLEANRVDRSVAEVRVEGEGRRIAVRLEEELPAGFARLVGIDRFRVGIRSVAEAGGVAALRGAVPLGVAADAFTYGSAYCLRLGSEECAERPLRGNYHALALGGTGASTYRENLADGYAGRLAVGDWVETEPGAMSGPTRQGLEERLAADPDATYETVSAGSPRLLYVPVIEGFEEAHGRDSVTIVGFAAFFLEAVQPDGTVIGRFLRTVAEGEMAAADPMYGLKAVRLAE